VPQDLINQVAGGLVDVAIMYAPQHRPGLKIDLLMEEELVLVTTDPAASGIELDCVHVDWGPDFTLHHGVSFPDATPALVANLGPLALSYVLSAGGFGYFRMQAVHHHVEAGRLHLVPGAPRFSYPVYLVYSANADEGVLAPALAGLRTLTTVKGNS
jgi:LysR family transcriptional regulator, flagellar master operon regulator